MTTGQYPSELSDRQLQARLERMLAARKAADNARLAKYNATRTKRSAFRAAVKASSCDIRLAPTPAARHVPPRFTWRDAGAFLLPVVLFAAMVLLAHWAGWIR